MSHDGIWRAACLVTIKTTPFRFGIHKVARGVTDPGVGSGALLGKADEALESVQSRFNSGTPKRPSK